MTRQLRSLATIAFTLVIASLGTTAQARSGGNCAYRLDPISRSGDVVQARLVKLGCFDTFAQAVAAGTDGSVALTPSATPSALTDSEIARSTLSVADVLIGTEFTVFNYGGSSNSYYAPDACAGNTYEVAYVGDAWNDDFASGKGFGGCDHNKKFAASNFLGDVITCTPNCSDYGIVRNLVSSLRWKP